MVDKQLVAKFKQFQKKTGKYKGFKLENMAFETVSFSDSDVFTFVKGLNKYVRTYIDNNAGEIAVMGSSLDNNCITSYIVPIAETDIIRAECVSFNKDNAKGSRAFFRNFPFVMDRHHLALIPNAEKVNAQYLYQFLDYFLQTKSYGWGTNVASVDEIKNYDLVIPKPQNDVFSSLDIQEILVEFIAFYQKESDNKADILSKISHKINEIDAFVLPLFFVKHPSVQMRFDGFCKVKKLKLKLEDLVFEEKFTQEIGDFQGGDSKLTREFMSRRAGNYAVYSASTDIKTQGISGYIDTFMYDEETIHITKNGEKTGTVFLISKQKHSINGDRAIYRVDTAAYLNKYVYYALKSLRLDEKHDWGNKLSKSGFEEYTISMPKPLPKFTSLELQQIIVEFTEIYFHKMNKQRQYADKLSRLFVNYNQLLIQKTFKN